MFNFLKSSYSFTSEVTNHGTRSILVNGNRPAKLQDLQKDPNLKKDYSSILRLADTVSRTDLTGFNEQYPGLFNDEDLAQPLCVVEGNEIHLSFPMLYAIKFEPVLEQVGLSESSLDFLNLPPFDYLIIKLAFGNKLDAKEFQVVMTLLDEKHEKIDIQKVEGFRFYDISGRVFFITPEQKRMVEFVESFNRKKNSSFNDRVRGLAEIKELAKKCAVSLTGSIKDREYLSVDELKVNLGRGVNGEFLLEPSISPDQTVNKLFRNSYHEVQKLDGQRLRGTNAEGREVLISFSEKADTDKEKIERVKNSPEEFQLEVLQNPEEHFRQSQLEGFALGENLSNRITGFLFGRPEGDDWTKEKNSNAWNTGYEGESLFLQSKDGFLTEVDLSTIPEFYPEIASKVEEFKEKLEEEELVARLEDDDFLTPIPSFNTKTIELESLDGKYTIDSLVSLTTRIEIEYQPEITEEDLEHAREVLGRSEGCHSLVEWESEMIPHNSLRRGIKKREQKERQKQKIENVSFNLEDREGSSFTDGFKSTIVADRPPSMKPEFSLKDHQVEGYSWLRSLWDHEFEPGKRGALLADDMGLGKTLQVISLISFVKKQEEWKEKPILIVAPISLIDGSWIEEGFEFFIDSDHISSLPKSNHQIHNLKNFKFSYPRHEIFHEAKQLQNQMILEEKSFSELQLSEKLTEALEDFKTKVGSSILVTSYETLRSRMFEVSFLDFSLVVLDEAQKIKSGNSLQNRAARSLRADMNVAMTGTPIENGMMDLWNLMDFVSPNTLGTRKDFKHEFVSKISTAAPGTPEREELKMKLENKLSPFWLRRVKEDVLKGKDSLPPITYYDSLSEENKLVNKHEVEISDSQSELYKQKMSIYNSVGGGERLAIIRQLLEICSASWLPLEEELTYQNFPELFRICPKLKVTFDILDEIYNKSEEEGRKVVLFANIIQIQESLAWLIKEWAKHKHKEKVEVEVYNGSEKCALKRKEILQRFDEADGFKALIISPKAGGAGLNIQCANHVIHYTREWNPALENQATARCYRIGQKRPVHVYFPTTTGGAGNPTAEENLANVLRAKRSIMEDFTISNSEFEVGTDEFVQETGTHEDFPLKMNDLKTISHKQFERFVAKVFERMGFQTDVVGGANDRGADIICFGEHENFIIQAKQKQTSTKELNAKAINEVRQALSTYTHQHGKEFKLLVVTNGKFSSRAHMAVKQGGGDVDLKDGNWLRQQLAKHSIKYFEIK